MSTPKLDVLAIGNAIVDIIADADDRLLSDEGLAKGSMRLVDEVEADRLYAAMGPAREASGGSAANTVAGLASLGLAAGFIGQVADDQLGEIFAHDIGSLGVAFDTAPRSGIGATARCLILVTPDAQRTMNTFLGASQHLGHQAIDAPTIASAAILYLEGYLWDPPEPRSAMEAAIAIARSAGRRVAFTCSDTFCVDRHRRDFLRLIGERRIDLLFANEAELHALSGETGFEAALAAIAPQVGTLVVTRSEQGAVAVRGDQRAAVAAAPISRLVDTTGAGDLFAAGFLAGEVRQLGLERSLRLGAICAAEVIQHYGARPQAELRELAGALLG